jgi:hypothetical protein
MNKTTCIAECDTLGHSLKQVHIIIYIRHIRKKIRKLYLNSVFVYQAMQ